MICDKISRWQVTSPLNFLMLRLLNTTIYSITSSILLMKENNVHTESFLDASNLYIRQHILL